MTTVCQDPLYLRGLNAEQRDAVLTDANTALQVLAGAGTGKTELISRRFVKLVQDFREQGLDNAEAHILVVTFTSDAAAAMRERIHQRLLDNGESGLGANAWISTFHQFCMQLVRTHATLLGLPPDFTILNPLDQELQFKRLLRAVLVGEHADLSALFANTPLQQRLPVDVLSLRCLQETGLDDIENLLDADRLFRLINRIKTAGLSPVEFLTVATQQARQLTEQLQNMPLPHDKDLKPIDNIQLKMEAWQHCLASWATDSWDPIRQAEEKAEQSGKKVTASVYKDALPLLGKFYLAPRSYEPLTPDVTALDTALAQEICLIQIITAVYALYQQTLLEAHACDFDDLINHSIRLLSDFPVLRDKYQTHFKAIIVDEFQDSNGSQLRLLELLMQEGAKNLTVVGDEKQSIYGFRFAQAENLNLIFRHGPYKKVNLRINYRSRPPILAIANQLTERMTTRHTANQHLKPCEAMAERNDPKVIWVDWDAMMEEEGDKASHPPIDVQKEQESAWIAQTIARLVQAEQRPFSDIAVLVKSHTKAEMIQQRLADFGIPSVRKKNLGFFQEDVIKDAMALLRLMQNLGNDLSLVRLLQRKLNHRQLHALATWRKTLQQQCQMPFSLFEACLRLQEPSTLSGNPNELNSLSGDNASGTREPVPTNSILPDLPPIVIQAVGDLAARLYKIRREKSRVSPAQLFLNLAQAVDLVDSSQAEWRQKQQRIQLHTFEKLLHLLGQARPLRPTLDEVLETLEHYAADPRLDLPVSESLSGEDAVQLMTVYAAKGLEFPIVFVAYTELGRVSGTGVDSAILFDPQYAGKSGFGLILGKPNGLPSLKREVYQKCWLHPQGEQEAQRVFYVALTRAQERLYVLRGSRSFPWTSPDSYPADAQVTLSETNDATAVNTQISPAERQHIRQAMADLQESRRSRTRGGILKVESDES